MILYAGEKDWGKEAGDLFRRKPRSLKQRFGSNGPTPEQLIAYNNEVREWNSAYRKATRNHKAQPEESNKRWREMSESEQAAWVAQ